MTPTDKNNPGERQEPEILVNQNQATLDPTVVVAEPDRTVVLTEEETIIIDKPEQYEIIPANRPRKVYGGMWGPIEIAAFGVSLIVLLGVFALYLFFVKPSANKLEEIKAERDRLEQELISARAKYGSITNTETQVSTLLTSSSDFESNYLPIAENGRTALYQRLNALIASNSLTNTNGPNYAPLEYTEEDRKDAAEGQDEKEQRGRQKYRSIFPGVYVTMTVEGSYQNLRRFIQQIETGNEFVIISSIELEPTETKKKENPEAQQQQVPQPNVNPYAGNTMRQFDPRNPTMPRPPVQAVPQQPVEEQKGKMHGETVSLRLEMAAYFRRPNFVPASEGSVQ